MFATTQCTDRVTKRGQIKALPSPSSKETGAKVIRSDRAPSPRRPEKPDSNGAMPPGGAVMPTDGPAEGESIAQYLDRMRGKRECRRSFAW